MQCGMSTSLLCIIFSSKLHEILFFMCSLLVRRWDATLNQPSVISYHCGLICKQQTYAFCMGSKYSICFLFHLVLNEACSLSLPPCCSIFLNALKSKGRLIPLQCKCGDWNWTVFGVSLLYIYILIPQHYIRHCVTSYHRGDENKYRNIQHTLAWLRAWIFVCYNILPFKLRAKPSSEYENKLHPNARSSIVTLKDLRSVKPPLHCYCSQVQPGAGQQHLLGCQP